jgi:catechol 2,3-dioxygenase
LRVADLDRSVAFYRDVLGFVVKADARPAIGLPVVFLAAGDYHHHLALNTFESLGGTPAPKGHTGLFHIAFLYPSKEELVNAVQRLQRCAYPIDGVRDHGGTVSVYLRDPDGNGLELYYDLPREAWFDAQGRPNLKNEPLELSVLLEGANDEE